MAKKTLNEAVVRRFQKLANLAPINEMYSQNEEYMNEEEGAEELAPPADAGMDDMDAAAEEPVEMDGDLELTDEEAQAIIDLGSKLEAAMGDMGDMDDMGGEEEMPADDMGGEEDMGEEDIMEALRGINYAPSKSEVVNEVAKRVAKRLKTAKLHEAKLNRALGRKK
jgi:spore coat protein CotH